MERSKVNSNYEDWLKRHDETVQKAVELIKKYGFEPIIINEQGKPSFIRIFLGEKKIDFAIKEIKTKFAQKIWLCKKSVFNPENIYLVYASEEDMWLVSTGRECDREGSYEESDFQKDVKFVVISIDVLRPAKTFLKLIKERYDNQLQKKITEF